MMEPEAEPQRESVATKSWGPGRTLGSILQTSRDTMEGGGAPPAAGGGRPGGRRHLHTLDATVPAGGADSAEVGVPTPGAEAAERLQALRDQVEARRRALAELDAWNERNIQTLEEDRLRTLRDLAREDEMVHAEDQVLQQLEGNRRELEARLDDLERRKEEMERDRDQHQRDLAVSCGRGALDVRLVGRRLLPLLPCRRYFL
jgi:DNA repair exonuclease SbcCD ATPase subunit